MEANELMIGDWVNIYAFTNNVHEQKDLYPAIITSIIVGAPDESLNSCEGIIPKSDGGYKVFARPIDTISPIPLTEKILLKNNFEKHFDEDSIIYTHPQGINIEMGINYKLFDDGHFFVKGIQHRLHYVHELQHALKLFEIDKTIEL